MEEGSLRPVESPSAKMLRHGCPQLSRSVAQALEGLNRTAWVATAGIRLMSGIQMEHSVALANRQRESRN